MGRNIAIMQPYFFPYHGYFQLIASVDKFIFFNDVNYIKRGWINRNRILVNNSDFFITVPIVNASQNALICRTEINKEKGWNSKLLRTIELAYKKATYFEETIDLIREVLLNDYRYIDELAANSVVHTSRHLNIKTIFQFSQSEYENGYLKGEDRIIDICLREKASYYTNLPGGRTLYNYLNFYKKNIKLQFIDPTNFTYHQSIDSFYPNLSIIDVLMFNGKNATSKLVTNFSLI